MVIDRKRAEKFQKDEITEHFFYKKLALADKNKKVLKHIAEDELRHYNLWKKYSGKDVKPSKFKIRIYDILSKIFGITFAIKLMEKGEENSQKKYFSLKNIPEVKKMLKDEREHENKLLSVIEEEKLEYLSSMALGVNDALVEITGVLAGLSLAFQNTKIVGVIGMITGISAALSMASSEYLSQRTESSDKNPAKAAFYTGLIYFITVLLLVVPFFIFKSYYYALLFSMILAVLVILFFSFFISVTKDFSFKRRALEMIVTSIGVAAVSFVIGYLVRTFFGIEV